MSAKPKHTTPSHAAAVADEGSIVVKGARVNNLKNIDVTIPGV